MKVKLVYEAQGETELLRYLQLQEFPTKGQVLDVGGGVMLEVIEATATPESTFQKVIATVRPLKAAPPAFEAEDAPATVG
jgi:hypothetical protein